MPNNLSVTSPSGVLPKMTFTSFVEDRVYPTRSVFYHDGKSDRSLIEDGVNPPDAIRTWNLSARLTPTALATLTTFYHNHQGSSFYFYSPFEPEAGYAVGSNWDTTGDATFGRYSVKFTNQTWQQTMDIARSNVTFSLQEVA